MSSKIAPTLFMPKPPMRNREFDIHYNRDISLSKVDSHCHSYYEFYFFISGNVTYTVESNRFSLHPGDILLIDPGQHHFAVIDDFSSAYERYVLWLTPEFLEKLSSESTNLLLPFSTINFTGSHLHLTPDIRLIMTNLLQMLLIQANSQEYGADLLINAYITELLIYIAKIKLYQQPIYFEKDFNNNDLILHALNYITDHIHEDIRIEDITTYLFISKSHLARLFSSCMGISAHQYIIKKKLYLAKQELLSSSSVEDICTSYAFGNYSSFFRAFKKEFGMSPRDFLKVKQIKGSIETRTTHTGRKSFSVRSRP